MNGRLPSLICSLVTKCECHLIADKAYTVCNTVFHSVALCILFRPAKHVLVISESFLSENTLVSKAFGIVPNTHTSTPRK